MFMVRAVGKSRSADHFIDKLPLCLRLALNWDLVFLFFSFNLPWKLLDLAARRAVFIPYYVYVYGINIKSATIVRGFCRENRAPFT